MRLHLAAVHLLAFSVGLAECSRGKIRSEPMAVLTPTFSTTLGESERRALLLACSRVVRAVTIGYRPRERSAGHGHAVR